MRLIKLALWISAWSCWAWLGFGLYRQLPRHLAPPFCTINLEESERPWGFRDGREMITQAPTRGGGGTTFRYYDVSTGRLTREITGPFGEVDLEFAEANAVLVPRYGRFLTSRRAAPEGVQKPRAKPVLSVLNLESGAWIDLPADVEVYEPTLHGEKPWAIFSMHWRADRHVVHVVDLTTGAVLFRWDGKREGVEPRRLNAAPFFVGASRIGIPTAPPRYKPDAGGHRREAVEIWSIPGGTAPEQEFAGLHVGDDPVGSASGRVAWHEKGNSGWLDVFDFDASKKVFEFPKDRGEPRGDYMGQWPGPELSTDGRAAFSYTGGTLWDVDGGRPLWNEADERKWFAGVVSEWFAGVADDVFQVKERWTVRIFDALTWDKDTFAVRDFRTGKLRYRCWDPPIGRPRFLRDGQGVDFDGESIRPLPPPPDWPLLALCQTILALPLILLWAILRWRHKRRRRMASVSP